MPSGPTVQERIVDDVMQVLSGIAGPPNYNTVLGSTPTRVYGSLKELGESPSIAAYIADTNNSVAAVNGLTQVDMLLKLWLVIQDVSVDWSEKLSLFVADIHSALMQDIQRNGLALVTDIVGSDLVQGTRDADLAWAEVDVRVQFRHPYADPTTAQ